MASFSIPPAHQARHKQQATEDLEYENKIQEAMNGLHSGSIRAAATALGLIQSSAYSHPSNPSPPSGYSNNFFGSQYNR